MRLAVIIPTTNGPAQILRITRLSRAPLSQVITADDFVPNAEMAARYHALIDRSGPLRGLIALGDVRFELCLDRLPEMGRSWELPVAIAHWAIDNGHELVTSEAELVVWATGVVKPERQIAEEDYHLELKLGASLGLLEQAGRQARLLVLLPGCTSEAQIMAFCAQLPSARVVKAANVDAAVAVVEENAESRARPKAPLPLSSAFERGSKRHGFRRVMGVGVLGLVTVAGVGLLPMLPGRGPVVSHVDEVSFQQSPISAPTAVETAPAEVAEAAIDRTTPPAEGAEAATGRTDASLSDNAVQVDPAAMPVVEAATAIEPTAAPEPDGEAQVDRTAPPVADAESAADPTPEQTPPSPDPAAIQNRAAPPLLLVEYRAPPGASCLAVLFGSANAIRLERQASSTAFPASDLGGLCAVSFEMAGGRTQAQVTLPTGFLARVLPSNRLSPVELGDPILPLFHFVEGVAPLTYELTLTDAAGEKTTFRHNLVVH